MYYHVSPIDLDIGAVIYPGRHGQIYRQFRPGGPMPNGADIASVMWEIALEAARIAAFPALPSRFDCVFVWETQDHSVRFRDRFRPGRPIFIVRPFGDAEHLKHRGDFGILDAAYQAPYADYMAEGSKRYWSAEPSDMVEVILSAPVRVIGRHD